MPSIPGRVKNKSTFPKFFIQVNVGQEKTGNYKVFDQYTYDIVISLLFKDEVTVETDQFLKLVTKEIARYIMDKHSRTVEYYGYDDGFRIYARRLKGQSVYAIQRYAFDTSKELIRKFMRFRDDPYYTKSSSVMGGKNFRY